MDENRFFSLSNLSVRSIVVHPLCTLPGLILAEFVRSTTQGIRGIYRGFDVAVLGVATWRALYFGFYDTLTVHMLGGRRNGTLQQRWALAQVVTTVAGT